MERICLVHFQLEGRLFSNEIQFHRIWLKFQCTLAKFEAIGIPLGDKQITMNWCVILGMWLKDRFFDEKEEKKVKNNNVVYIEKIVEWLEIYIFFSLHRKEKSDFIFSVHFSSLIRVREKNEVVFVVCFSHLMFVRSHLNE